MKHNIPATAFLMVFAAMFVVSTVTTARAADSACSFARVAGNYGFSDSGTVVGVGARAAVGLLTFDAAGNISGPVTASLGGSVTRTTLSGTYAVNPDCTGTASFGEFDQSNNLILTATVAIVWDANLQEARFLFTSVVLADGTALPTVINGDARKLVP